MAIVATGLLGTGLPAAAAPRVFTTCNSMHGDAVFDPGVTSTPTPQTIDIGVGDLAGCTGRVTTGTLQALISTEDISCDAPPTGAIIGSGPGKIKWMNTGGQKSTIFAKLQVVSPPVYKLKGTVTAGKFVGTSANPTKITVQFRFTPGAGQDCFSGTVHTARVDNTSDLVIKSKF